MYFSTNKEKYKERRHLYRRNNADKINEHSRNRYRENCKSIRAQHRSYSYTEAYRIKVRKRHHHRMKHDLKYRTIRNLRSGLRRFVITKGISGTKLLREAIGCTWDEFKIYIEERFYNHPITGEVISWDHPEFTIDHVVPCEWFDTLDPEQAKKANHFSNLQPMFASENSSKGAHITYRVESPHLRYDRDGSQVFE